MCDDQRRHSTVDDDYNNAGGGDDDDDRDALMQLFSVFWQSVSMSLEKQTRKKRLNR